MLVSLRGENGAVATKTSVRDVGDPAVNAITLPSSLIEKPPAMSASG